MRNELDGKLAKRICILRANKQISLDEFAQLSDISRATLSRIERCETSPTAQMLGRIASVLGVTVSELFETIEDKSEEVFYQKDRKIWTDPENGFMRSMICPPSRNNICELTKGMLPPYTKIEYPRALDGAPEQIIYVMSGSLVFFHNGNCISLEKGDAFRFIFKGATYFENKTNENCEYLVIIGRKP